MVKSKACVEKRRRSKLSAEPAIRASSTSLSPSSRGYLVSWCFKPSHSQRNISELREIFIKRYIVERTSKAEIRPEGQSEKAESCRENLWNEI